MTDVEGVRNLIGTGVIDFFGGILTAIFAFCYLIKLSVQMTIVSFRSRRLRPHPPACLQDHPHPSSANAPRSTPKSPVASPNPSAAFASSRATTPKRARPTSSPPVPTPAQQRHLLADRAVASCRWPRLRFSASSETRHVPRRAPRRCGTAHPRRLHDLRHVPRLHDASRSCNSSPSALSYGSPGRPRPHHRDPQREEETGARRTVALPPIRGDVAFDDVTFPTNPESQFFTASASSPRPAPSPRSSAPPAPASPPSSRSSARSTPRQRPGPGRWH